MSSSVFQLVHGLFEEQQMEPLIDHKLGSRKARIPSYKLVPSIASGSIEHTANDYI